MGETPARGRPSLIVPADPFALLDLMMRGFLAGLGDAGSRLPGVRGRSGNGHGARLHTREDAARRSGLDPADVERLWQALGFAGPAEAEAGYTDEDVRVMSEVARALDEEDVDLDLLIGMVRPMGQLVSRLGAAQVSALATVPQRGAAKGPGTQAAADRLLPALEHLVVHAWRRHVLAAAAGVVPLGPVDAATRSTAVGFLDITGYTALSRRIDWADLADLLERFEACAFDQVVRAHGRVVKTLGDEVLFVADDAATGAEIALAVVEAARDDPHLPRVHGGLSWGPVLDRAGDVFGPTVNVASRVADLAGPGAVLVDAAIGDRLAGDDRFRLERRLRRPVRGYPSLVTLRLTRRRGRRTPS